MKRIKPKVFICECQDRDHFISAHHWLLYKNEEYISLEFKGTTGDWQMAYSDYKIVNFFKRLRWRLKQALRILFKGYYEFEDEWIPMSFDGDAFRGQQNLKEFINWLETTIIHIEKNVRENKEGVRNEK